MTLGAQLTTVSDAPSCGITNDHHSDNSRGVIYNRNIFIIQLSQPLISSQTSNVNRQMSIEKNTQNTQKAYYTRRKSLGEI